jgi:hypothetical protein
MFMIRAIVASCVLVAPLFLLQSGEAGGKAVKSQMVKGVIKQVDTEKDVLVVKQKVKNEFVDRELSILDTTEIVLKIGQETKSGIGKAALKILEGREGAAVAVKCDKDVNVLKVTVTAKK